MLHDDLVIRAVKWLRNTKHCSLVIMDMQSQFEQPDAIGFKGNHSILVECKVSMSDFYNDKKKLFRAVPVQGMGEHRYYMVPTELIHQIKLPDNWGLLECKKRIVKVVVKAAFQSCNYRNERGLLISAARRLKEGYSSAQRRVFTAHSKLPLTVPIQEEEYQNE